MLVAVDTNVLIRLFVDDDPAQTKIAMETLETAEAIAIGLQALCEFAWVLGSHYKTARSDIAASIRRLLDTRNIVVNRPAVEAGLAMLDAGGDFADGIIAYEGSWLGASAFVTFDRTRGKRWQVGDAFGHARENIGKTALVTRASRPSERCQHGQDAALSKPFSPRRLRANAGWRRPAT